MRPVEQIMRVTKIDNREPEEYRAAPRSSSGCRLTTVMLRVVIVFPQGLRDGAGLVPTPFLSLAFLPYSSA